MTANLDWNIGRFMKALDEMGISEDTIVLISSDHGEMFGGHGRMKKNIFYDEAARIPFLLLWKGKIKPVRTDVCMNTVDIMPTILDLCGLGSEIPKEVEGVSLANAAFGKKCPNEPEVAFLMNTGACAAWENGHEWRAVRNKKFTYAVFKGGGRRNLPRKELLFDNENDPLQMNNLIADEAYESVKKHLSRIMQDKMAEINDTFADCTWYRENWTKDRIIVESARGKFPSA
jgi:arylsulfatase A-like enzyme